MIFDLKFKGIITNDEKIAKCCRFLSCNKGLLFQLCTNQNYLILGNYRYFGQVLKF